MNMNEHERSIHFYEYQLISFGYFKDLWLTRAAGVSFPKWRGNLLDALDAAVT